MAADVHPFPRPGAAAPEEVRLPDRFRTTRRFRGVLAARHQLSDGALACGVTLWRRDPRGWVVGLTWTDGGEGEARANLCDTLEEAVRFVEREGPDGPAAGGWKARTPPGLDPAEALVQPFLRRQAAVRLRRLHDELVGRALMDWQAGFGAPTDGRA